MQSTSGATKLFASIHLFSGLAKLRLSNWARSLGLIGLEPGLVMQEEINTAELALHAELERQLSLLPELTTLPRTTHEIFADEAAKLRRITREHTMNVRTPLPPLAAPHNATVTSLHALEHEVRRAMDDTNTGVAGNPQFPTPGKDSQLVTQPVARTVAVQEPQEKSGAELLSDAAVNVIGKTHDEMIKQLDDVIVRLQNLKSSIQVRRDAAEHEIRGFIGTIGNALDVVGNLEKVIADIEENHL